MVRTPGVGNRSGAGGPGPSVAAGRAEVAFSTLAAYPQARQRTTRSSPASDGQANSTEALPPIWPLDARTGMAGTPRRSKLRV
jgi:hypothetical protein